MNGTGPVLPGWLKESPPAAEPRREHRRRRGFVEKSLYGFAEALRNELFAEQVARQPGLLQRLDPRVKVLTLLGLIGVAVALHQLLSLLLLNLWLFWLARSSRVPLRLFVRRVWIVVPLFTGVVVLPTLFNVVRPGTPLLVLFHLGHPVQVGPWTLPAVVTVTRQGAVSAALLVLRVGASVSLAVLLTLTTRWPALLKALGVLRLPAVFLSVLEMAYRYLFLLLQVSTETFSARRSRMVGRGTTREQRRFIASAMGSLWQRTQVIGAEVYGAMLSRGYTGTPRSTAKHRLRPSDGLWVLIVVLVSLFLLGGDRVLG